MNKRINVLNIIISIILLGLFVYGLVTKGESYTSTYGIKMLYLSAGINIVMLLFSLFKIIRDSIWMDIIYMIYLLLFIGTNFYSQIFGSKLKITGLFMWYPKWIKYFLILLLVVNVIIFIVSFGGVDEK